PGADAEHLASDGVPRRWVDNPVLARAAVQTPAVRAILTGFGEFQALAWHFIEREGLATGRVLLSEDRLLPLGPMLRVLGRVEREVGPEVLFKVGSSVPDEFINFATSPRELLDTLDLGYHAAHGLAGEPL